MSKASKIFRIIMLVLAISMLILSCVEAFVFLRNEPNVSISEDSTSWMFADSDDVISWLSTGFMIQILFWVVMTFEQIDRVFEAFRRR